MLHPAVDTLFYGRRRRRRRRRALSSCHFGGRRSSGNRRSPRGKEDEGFSFLIFSPPPSLPQPLISAGDKFMATNRRDLDDDDENQGGKFLPPGFVGEGGRSGPRCDNRFLDRSKVRILLCDNDEKSSREVSELLYYCSYQGIQRK